MEDHKFYQEHLNIKNEMSISQDGKSTSLCGTSILPIYTLYGGSATPENLRTKQTATMSTMANFKSEEVA